jgi:hypothetical protein
MSLFLKFRAAACSAALLAASCTTPSTGGTAEPLSLEAATEAMFADALARPAAASAAFDAEKLKAFAGDSAAITWSAAGPDKASGAYKLSGVRMEILGETPYTFLTANEVLLWNADLGAVEDRLAGKRLGETLKLFDRIEMSGVVFDLSDYMNAVESAAAEALPDSDVARVAYDGSTMKVDRVIFGAMTLHPWTFAPNEDGDDGVEAIRLVSALLRSVSLEDMVFLDAVVNQQISEDGIEGRVDTAYARNIVHGYDRGNIAALVTTGTTFTGTIPVPDVDAEAVEGAAPLAMQTIEMSGGYGYSSWSGLELANLLAWGEKGQLPPITERDLMNLGGGTLLDMNLAIGGQSLFDVGRVDYAMDGFTWFIPGRITASHEDASVDFTGFLKFAESLGGDAPQAEGEPSIADIIGVLERTGLGKLSGDGSFALTWDSKTGASVLESKGVTDNLFDGVTRFDFVLPAYASLVPAFEADGVTPKEGAMADLFEQQTAFAGARYSITDLGGLNAISSLIIEIAKLPSADPSMANFAESTPEGLRAFVSGMLLFGGGAVSSEVPQANAWISSLSKFVTDGGTFEFVAAPKKPLKLEDFTGAGPDAGMVESPSNAEIVDLLGITVTHTPPPKP